MWKRTKYGVAVVKIVFQLAYLSLLYPVKESFGYYLYKIASASIEIQGECRLADGGLSVRREHCSH